MENNKKDNKIWYAVFGGLLVLIVALLFFNADKLGLSGDDKPDEVSVGEDYETVEGTESNWEDKDEETGFSQELIKVGDPRIVHEYKVKEVGDTKVKLENHVGEGLELKLLPGQYLRKDFNTVILGSEEEAIKASKSGIERKPLKEIFKEGQIIDMEYYDKYTMTDRRSGNKYEIELDESTSNPFKDL